LAHSCRLCTGSQKPGFYREDALQSYKLEKTRFLGFGAGSQKSLHQQGADDAELLRNYPGLSGFDLENAWRYDDRHPEQIDRIIVSHQTDD